jgi:thioredoxin-like negative regulator of GroEL
MSGLLFLQSVDFSVQEGTKGQILCNSIRGISLILFYSTKCEYCQALIPIFKRLPGTIGGCQFGMINVTMEKEVVRMSGNTVSPIKYVPLIILFVNGKPFIRYDGPQDENEIRKFLVEVTSKLQTKEKFSSDKVRQGKNDKEIPAYTVGHPLYGQDNVSYLEFDEAYTPAK